MAAATAIISAGIGVASAASSFSQAAKQQRQMKEAGEAAAKYMEDARKKFSTNFAEQLRVPLEGYEMASDINRQTVSQNLDAMRESGQRSIIGGVAGLQQQAQEGAEQLRMGMQQDLYERDKAIVSEESRLRDIQGELDLGESAGAQQAAADAQALKAKSIESGFGSLASTATGLYESSDLYQKGLSGKVLEKYGSGLTPEQMGAVGSKLNTLDSKTLRKLYNDAPEGFSLKADFGVRKDINLPRTPPKVPFPKTIGR